MKSARLMLCALVLCAQPARAEGEVLLKGGVSMNDSERAALESEHEARLDAIDSAEEGLSKAHESKVRAIQEQDSDVKDLQVRDEDRKYERQMRDLERRRALEEKRYSARLARLGGGAPDAPPGGRDVPARMMKLAGEMDRLATRIQENAMTAGNEFFGGLSRSIGKGAGFLAQKPGTVLPQMVDALATYLTNDYNENNQMLYDDAVKAVDEIQSNPARFFGEHAVDIASSAAGGAAQMAEARAAAAAGRMAAAEKAGMSRLEQMRRRQARKLEEAARTLEGMAEDAKKFSTFGSSLDGGPDYLKIFGGDPALKGGVNPFKGKNNCFAVSLAAAKRRRTGRPYVAIDTNPRHPAMYDPATGRIELQDVGVTYDEIAETLKNKHGGDKAKYPFHGGLKGLRSHQEGWPVESSQKKIESAMRLSKDGSQGLVFVDGGEGTPGHVFNVVNDGGKIEFWDYQPDVPVQYVSFRDGRVVMKANGRMAEAPLPWKRVFFYRVD